MHQLLIVDDQPDLADDLAEMLPWDTVGITTVYRANSAPEALEIVRSHPVDVVITDIRMPGMSGLDLIERIRASWKKTRCILLSGYEDFEYARRALKNQVNDYLLKPADDKDLLAAVERAVKEVEEEWKDVSSLRNALHSVKKNLPILVDNLLLHLLEGRKVDEFKEQLEMLELPFTTELPVSLMLVRLEGYFDRYGASDASLMKYAVSNIAVEVFKEDFHLRNTKDIHGYLVFLVQQKNRTLSQPISLQEMMEMKATLVQHNVKQYLKGTVSILVSPFGKLPGDVHELYEQALSNFRQHIGSEREFLLSLNESLEESGEQAANYLTNLYDPPLLVHLLEAGQWESLKDKLDAIFEELEQKWGHSHEHILETYFAIASSFSFSIHKNKRWMTDIMGEEFQKLANGLQFHTIQQLRDWTESIVNKFRSIMDSETHDSRSNIVRQVQEYIQNHLEDASLQSIAAHVFLNPSYLSKIYKMETGEGISDFIYRLKMEQAAYKLRNSTNKVYEIASSLGYVKTSYFIKVFKEKYSMTPQEYRDKFS